VIGWLRRLSPRAEKSIRLLVTCVIAAPLGMISVANDDETLGFIAVAIVLAGIVAGPLVARVLFSDDR
jgi:hypothetical protein